MHPACLVAFGHLLVNDSAACRHPLHVARGDGATVAHAVAVLDCAGKNVGDGLDATMRMPGKAGEIVLWDVIAEVVEQQEWVEVGGVAKAEGAAKMHSSAFERGLGLNEPLDGSDRHGKPPGMRWMTMIIAGLAGSCGLASPGECRFFPAKRGINMQMQMSRQLIVACGLRLNPAGSLPPDRTLAWLVQHAG